MSEREGRRERDIARKRGREEESVCKRVIVFAPFCISCIHTNVQPKAASFSEPVLSSSTCVFFITHSEHTQHTHTQTHRHTDTYTHTSNRDAIRFVRHRVLEVRPEVVRHLPAHIQRRRWVVDSCLHVLKRLALVLSFI